MGLFGKRPDKNAPVLSMDEVKRWLFGPVHSYETQARIIWKAASDLPAARSICRVERAGSKGSNRSNCPGRCIDRTRPDTAHHCFRQ